MVDGKGGILWLARRRSGLWALPLLFLVYWSAGCVTTPPAKMTRSRTQKPAKTCPILDESESESSAIALTEEEAKPLLMKAEVAEQAHHFKEMRRILASFRGSGRVEGTRLLAVARSYADETCYDDAFETAIQAAEQTDRREVEAYFAALRYAALLQEADRITEAAEGFIEVLGQQKLAAKRAFLAKLQNEPAFKWARSEPASGFAQNAVVPVQRQIAWMTTEAGFLCIPARNQPSDVAAARGTCKPDATGGCPEGFFLAPSARPAAKNGCVLIKADDEG